MVWLIPLNFSFSLKYFFQQFICIKNPAPADNFECEYFEKKLLENGDFEIITWPDQLDHPLPNPAGGPGAYPNPAWGPGVP